MRYCNVRDLSGQFRQVDVSKKFEDFIVNARTLFLGSEAQEEVFVLWKGAKVTESSYEAFRDGYRGETCHFFYKFKQEEQEIQAKLEEDESKTERKMVKIHLRDRRSGCKDLFVEFNSVGIDYESFRAILADAGVKNAKLRNDGGVFSEENFSNWLSAAIASPNQAGSIFNGPKARSR